MFSRLELVELVDEVSVLLSEVLEPAITVTVVVVVASVTTLIWVGALLMSIVIPPFRTIMVFDVI